MKYTNIVTKHNSPWASQADTINLDTSGLNWAVTKNPLVTLLDGKYPLPVQSHVSINRSDTNESIGIVGASYGPIQNSQIWEALHRSLNGFDFDITGGGYTHNGGRVFLQVDLGQSKDFTVHGEDFRNYVTLYSSHDGSSAFEVFDTSVRIICENTLQASRRHGGKRFKLRVKHTSNVQFRFENMMVSLEKIFATRRKTFMDLNHLNEIMMEQHELRDWAVGFFNTANKLTGQASGKAAEAVRLAERGIGNRGETAYDMLNGVTEMLTHGRQNTKRDKGDLFITSEFGSAADQKANAFDGLLNNRARSLFVNRGRELRLEGETVINRPTMTQALAV